MFCCFNMSCLQYGLMLDTGCWMLDAGYWLLVTGYCLLSTRYWSPVSHEDKKEVVFDFGFWILDCG